MAFNPFHQFEVYPLIKLSLAGHDVSFTNAAMFMMLAVTLIIAFFYLTMRNARLVPTRWQCAAEMIFQFTESTLLDSAGEKSRPFVPFVFTLFTFILTLNLLGMLPYGYTVTSSIMVNFALATMVFILVIITGFVRHGWHFFSFFLPEGTPIILAPLIILIELISFLSRPITLTLRLAGNMLAGHVLLKVLASFVLMMGAFGVMPIAFTMVMSGFEFFVAVLQAYIFTILTCVYLNDAINLHQ